jgi:hypothetical protein
VAASSGVIEAGDDCNDAEAKIYPGAWDGPIGDGNLNACDGVDNDCDGTPDDGKLVGGGLCVCTPGASRTCATDSPPKLGTCAGGTETCAPDATWGDCSVQPAAKDSCVPGNDDNCNGVNNEKCPCIDGETQPCGACGDGMQTCAGGTWGGCMGAQQIGQPCGSCGGTVACGGGCSIPTPGNYGQGCGSCGGKIACDGTCSVATPANWNQACGSCGGKITCGGVCSVATPGNWNQACGSCGGKITCGGVCSVATPPNIGAACGNCGGTITCGATCSVNNPPNYGQACGSCGGTITCGGTCSIPNPGNLGQACGSCGGVIQCNSQCSNNTQLSCPPDWPGVVDNGNGTCTVTPSVLQNQLLSDYWYPVNGYIESFSFPYNTHGAGVVSNIHMSFLGGGCFCNGTAAIKFQGNAATIDLNETQSGCPGMPTMDFYDQGLGNPVDVYKDQNWTPFAQPSCHKNLTVEMYATVNKQCSWP